MNLKDCTPGTFVIDDSGYTGRIDRGMLDMDGNILVEVAYPLTYIARNVETNWEELHTRLYKHPDQLKPL
jgi:hypothetical protein